MNIFDLDEGTKSLLTLGNFLGGLTIPEFIETLSKDHSLLGTQVNDLEYLDPKPYIRTFESTIQSLYRLSDECLAKVKTVSAESSELSIKHNKNVIKVDDKLNDLMSLNSVLVDKINTTSTVITPLGEEMLKLSKTKSNSQEVIQLLINYQEFSKTGTLSKDWLVLYDDTFTNHSNSIFAKHLVNLINLSKNIMAPDLPGSQKVYEGLLVYRNNLLETLIQNFDQQFSPESYETLQNITSTYFTLRNNVDEDDDLIKLFLARIPGLDMEVNLTFDTNEVSNPLVHKGFNPPYLAQISQVLLESFEDQSQLILKIFPQSFTNKLLSMYITRLYSEFLLVKISTILSNAASISNLTYCRALYGLHTWVIQLTKDLKGLLNESIEYDRDSLNNFLDQGACDLFQKFTGVIIEKETSNLEDYIYSVISSFNAMRPNRMALANQLNYARGSSGTSRLSGSFKMSSAFQNFMRSRLDSSTSLREKYFKKQHVGNGDVNETQVSLEKVNHILQMTVESLARVVELNPDKSSQFALEVLEILIIGLGEHYVNIGLEISYQNLKELEGKESLDLQYLEITNQTSQILYLFSTSVQTIIIPLALNDTVTKDKMIQLSNGFIFECEESINLIVDETISYINLLVNRYLVRQPRKEFVPNEYESTNLLSSDTTLTCEKISRSLETVHEQLHNIFKSGNLVKILEKIGDSLISSLVNHINRFKVINVNGGIILTKDIIKYQSVVSAWGIQSLNDRFGSLREKVNLITVRSSTERDLINI
ncbi:hypothetical protein LJB42_002073 [Komagataella kurtzmanii]|nr:hypothetical protein LJB42_002073 [Komagataella kurtzmanii]